MSLTHCVVVHFSSRNTRARTRPYLSDLFGVHSAHAKYDDVPSLKRFFSFPSSRMGVSERIKSCARRLRACRPLTRSSPRISGVSMPNRRNLNFAKQADDASKFPDGTSVIAVIVSPSYTSTTFMSTRPVSAK